MKDSNYNLAFIVFAIALSIAAAAFGYSYPGAAEKSAPTAVTAISIIFSLSLALSTISSNSAKLNISSIKDRLDRTEVERIIASDDIRTVYRQSAMICISLIAITVGVFLIAAYSVSTSHIITRIAATVYCFFATLSFMVSFLIPMSLAVVAQRNIDLR